MKRRIAIISGWFGKARTSDIRNYDNRDGTSDYMLNVLEKLRIKAELVTDLDEIKATKSSFACEFHLNVQTPLTQAPKICYLTETPEIRPQNLFRRYVRYKRIYGFQRESSPSPGYVWTPYPHQLKVSQVNGFLDRDILFTMIASNRNVLFNGKKSLYTERQKIIDFFCRSHPNEMQLYGADWDKPFQRPGLLPRIKNKIDNRFKWNTSKKTKKVWQGIVESKHPVLQRTKFNFCYENIKGVPGYVSEKIYDSAANGAIPIYIPSSDDHPDLIPKDYILIRGI